MTVVVFGVFDLFHPGHRYFLDQSRSYGDSLIVVVTRDSIVSRLKSRLPIDDENARLNNVRNQPGVDIALFGDEELGVYSVLHEYRPTVICLGHDQTALRRDLEYRIDRKTIQPSRLISIDAYHPDKYSSTILRKLRLS